MPKAFIFDLDGVLINNEPLWQKAKEKMFKELFGLETYSKLGITVGMDMHTIYERAIGLGAHVSRQELLATFNKQAFPIYNDTPITEGIQKLGELLVKHKYAIGIVSASPKDWMELVIKRLAFRDKISVVISLEGRKDLKHKPSPDGYVEAMKQLGETPKSTIILEDSNTGIASVKKARAFVIGLKQNLVKGYVQEGADIYAKSLDDVIKIVLKRNSP